MKLFRNLALFVTIVTITISCSKDELELQTSQQENEVLENDHSVLSKQQLEIIAKSMVSYINNDDVKSEIISYATKSTDNEVYRPFKDILGYSKSQKANKSVFADKLSAELNQCSTCKFNNKSSKEILEILKDHYVISAPYLAEDFSDSKEPITISWWDGKDNSGTTPGILSTNAQNDVITKELVTVDDDYASNHPTIVIMPLEDPIFVGNKGNDLVLEGDGGGGTGGSGTTRPRDIDCRTLGEDVTLRLEMPQVQLHNNTRAWPNSNQLYIWAITGDFSVNSNGFISSSPNTNAPWGSSDGFKISRRNVKKKNWVGSGMSFLKSNWKRSQLDLKIIVAARNDGRGNINISDQVSVDSSGDFARDTSVDFSISSSKHAYVIFDVNFDRCTTLGEITTDGGYGIRNSYQIYHFNGFSFYLRPVTR